MNSRCEISDLFPSATDTPLGTFFSLARRQAKRLELILEHRFVGGRVNPPGCLWRSVTQKGLHEKSEHY